MLRTTGMLLKVLLSVVLTAATAEATDLGTQYVATLDHSKQPRGFDWNCDAADVWQLKEFTFALGDDFRLELGDSQAVFGHHNKNVLWAAIFPKEPGKITKASDGQGERITSVWLRFHPARLSELFPAKTVGQQGDAARIKDARRLAAHKMRSCWQASGRPMVPLRESITIDLETSAGSRRFFTIDTTKRTVIYVDAFRNQILRPTPKVNRETALAVFDKVWNAFDREYAMFVVKPKVDWDKLRDEYRPRAAEAKDNEALAQVLSAMLDQLEDLHVFVQVNRSTVGGYTRSRPLNASSTATEHLVGTLTETDHDLTWARTDDGIGYIQINRLRDPQMPQTFDEVLPQMQDTRGLILDLRFNGGGSETLARQVAGSFLDQPRVYAMHQFRSGPKHSDLGEKKTRICAPRDPWHYTAPVVVLQSQRTMSSAEAFALMMGVCPQVTTMGDRTAGSSANPRRIDAGAGIVVNLPRWNPLDSEGKPFDTVGVEPDVTIDSSTDDFGNQRDPVLSAALLRLRSNDEPGGEVLRLRPGARRPSERPRVISVSPADGATDVDPTTEIRIRFDRPMNPDLFELYWTSAANTGARLRGEAQYRAESNEFVFPVTLTPLSDHRVKMNYVSMITGFFSGEMVKAPGYEWRFRTRDFPAIEDAGQRVVAIEPKPGSKTSAFTKIRVTFDGPVQPQRFEFVDLVENASPLDRSKAVAFPYTYDSATHSLEIPVLFPQGKSARIGLRSTGGEVKPITIEYEVSDQLHSDATSARIASAASAPELRDLVQRVRQRRRNLKSVAETVRSADPPNRLKWDRLIDDSDDRQCKFWLQGSRQFHADVSQYFSGKGFHVASDGKQCWRLHDGKVIAAPYESIDLKNVVICDAFGVDRFETTEQVIQELMLEYLGDEQHDGMTCHRVRVWRAQLGRQDGTVDRVLQDWLFNAETMLPVLHEQLGRYGYHGYQYKHEQIDQPLSADLFQPPSGDDLKTSAPEPLGDGFNRRFLNACDGSDGRMTVRWGKQGPRGRHSGGLN